MPDIKRYREVLMGAREYLVYSTVQVDTAVTLEMVFDGDLTVDDIQVQYFTTTSTGNPPVGEIGIKYPDNSEFNIVSSVSNWSMNQNADNRHLWYSLPPYSSLYWKPANPDIGLEAMVVLTVVGRTPE